ncbi:hypothetical protein JCM18899A_01370 [Nocardioides sp. AN3]
MTARPPTSSRAAGPRLRLALAVVGSLAGLLLSACDGSSAHDPATSRPSASASASASATLPAPPAASSRAPRYSRYAALGDSYTAAPGVPGRQSSDGCLRSSSNYPHQVAAALPVGQLVDVSCSAADTGDVRASQMRGLPGQLDAVAPGTDLVTIGLGGNDLDLFSRLMGGCLQRDPAAATGSPCTDALRPLVKPALDRIERNLVAVVGAVRARAPKARILLVGYPQIVPASAGCAAAPFAAADYPFVHGVNRGLSEAVARAAAAAKATYVDVWSASAGHDICAAQPWINGLTGPGAAPFHPFAVEQAAVARLVVAALG